MVGLTALVAAVRRLSSRWDSTFQPMVSMTSDGMVTPGTYAAGSGTTRVRATEEIC